MNSAVTVLVPAGHQQIAERVMSVIARETNKEPTELRDEATLAELNVDSVDVVMILNGIEDEFGVYLPVEQGFAGVKCLKDFVTLVTDMIAAQPSPASSPA